MKIFSPILKGTTTMSQGTTNLSGSFTGSLLGTAATASYADNFTVGGTLTAQTINVQIITSSIEFNTGSTRNGSTTANTHQFTGSVLMSGSLTVGGAINLDTSAVFPTVGLLNRTSDTTLYLKSATSGFALLDNSQNTMYSATPTSHIWGINNSEKMRINSSGSVGIGTSSPYSGAKLQVKTATDINLAIQTGTADATGIKLNAFNDAATINIPLELNGSILILKTAETERMRITSAGNVGIGGTPTAKLHVFTANNSNGGNAGGAFNNEAFVIGATGKGIIMQYDQTNNKGHIGVVEPGVAWGALVLQGISGNVGIGTSSPSSLLHAKTGGDGYNMLTIESTAGDAGIALKGGTGGTSVGGFTIQGQNGGSMVFVDRNSTPATRMTISSNGSIGAPSGTNIYNASDARLKQNVSTTTYGLNTISLLNPVKFNWINGFESTEDGKDMLGFVAQEVQDIIPEAVESFSGNSITIGNTVIDNPLRVNEKFIIPVLVKAIQELSSKNTSLEERLTALENN